MHTVYSFDGKVWPTIRVDEAQREGLDAIAITDHLNSRAKNNKNLPFISYNQAYEVAKPVADAKNIILIQGIEISKLLPPGHVNTIFISDADKLDSRDDMAPFIAAKEQNAFIFWNHPGDARQPDSTRWWPIHTQMLEGGMLHGIEIANSNTFYPEAFAWCLEKKLTMLGNTDAHSFRTPGSRRTMTLVFARERTSEALYEALKERRTAVYFKDHIFGEEKYLKELFENALTWTIKKTNKIVNGGEEVRITVENNSELTFYLKKMPHDRRITYFRNTSLVPYTIAPHSKQTFKVRLLEGIKGGDVNFRVENFIVKPYEGMDYTLHIDE